MRQYQVNFAEQVKALRKDIEVPIPPNPAAIKEGSDKLYVVVGHPEIYYDDIILLKDRSPEEVTQWINEQTEKEKETTLYAKLPYVYFYGKEKKVVLKGFFQDNEGNIWAYLQCENEVIYIINAEYYVWLEKEGYKIKFTGLNVDFYPLTLERNDEYVGVLKPISKLEYYEYYQYCQDNSNIKVPIRRSPVTIKHRKNYDTIYIVDGHPEIYCDGIMLLEDRTPEEVAKWIEKQLTKRRKIVTYKRIKMLYPREETMPLKLKKFAEEIPFKPPNLNIKENFILAYLESEDGDIVAVNAECYMWLKKEGYTLKCVSNPKKPLVLERNGKVVGLLATII